MEIIYKKIDELIPYINNPRNNDEAVDAVASSIKNFGFKVPIVIDSNGEIINGHTRLKAAKKLGLKEVPVITADDLSPEQVKAFRIADNKVAEIATWNEELLNIELGELAELDFNMEEFGFGDLEEIKEIEEDVDFDTTPPEEPTSQEGEIYQLGRHRLMVGDSTSIDHVTKLMNGQQADLLLTDPPYNLAYKGRTNEGLEIKNDNMDSQAFRKFLYIAFSVAKEVLKQGSSVYVWYGAKEQVNFHIAIDDAGFEIAQELIWNKNNMGMGHPYRWKHEPCMFGYIRDSKFTWYGDKSQTTVLNFDRPIRNGDHPTMKPVALFAYQMKNSTKEGDIVLDLFGGSGTTLIAAEQNGRNAYLMELDPRYADVIINRWEELTGEKAIKIK
ncbi:DNA modification methylase [Lactococcus petauri]|nr:DNA modification methylase [Lactococcus petauri]